MAKTVIIHQKKKKKHELKGPHKPRLKDNQHFLKAHYVWAYMKPSK